MRKPDLPPYPSGAAAPPLRRASFEGTITGVPVDPERNDGGSFEQYGSDADHQGASPDAPPLTGRDVEIDTDTGRVIDAEKSPGPYKGIRVFYRSK